jgi:hypothetical protein
MNWEHDLTSFLEDLQTATGIAVRSVRDLEALKAFVDEKATTSIGINTLKRLFGYLPFADPRASTLDVLARAMGYTSYLAYLASPKPGEPNYAAKRDEIRVLAEVSVPDPRPNTGWRLALQHIEWFDYWHTERLVQPYRFIWKDCEGNEVPLREGAFIYGSKMLESLLEKAREAGFYP